ncbi:hypothetical protein WJX72_002439 [[Myrmecia] bisecta]|uniref:BTB domain-containing protein n=1 Tax=[Myrmecia] bisecta TaxID=41462 RepID=A0AAW1QPH7_9CHLO
MNDNAAAVWISTVTATSTLSPLRLSTSGDYFEPGEPLIITVDDGEEDLLRALVKFVYTKELDLTEERALALSETGLSLSTALEVCQLKDSRDCHSRGVTMLFDLAALCVLKAFSDLDAVWADEAQRSAFLDLPLGALKARSSRRRFCGTETSV